MEQGLMVGVVLAVLVGLGLVACGGVDTERDVSGSIVEAGDVGVFNLRVGDCFDSPGVLLVNDEGAGGEAYKVEAVPCRESHDLELFAISELAGDTFPGEAATSVRSRALCAAAFEVHAAERPDASAAGMLVLNPTAESWGLGDRGVSCALDGADTRRDASGAIVEAGGVGFGNVRVGDCFQDPLGSSDPFVLAAVPCAQAHDNEVFAVFDLERDDYPGAEALEAEMLVDCEARLDSYIGGPLSGSRLSVFPSGPDEFSWDTGDRQVFCGLYNTDFTRLTGSKFASASVSLDPADGDAGRP